MQLILSLKKDEMKFLLQLMKSTFSCSTHRLIFLSNVVVSLSLIEMSYINISEIDVKRQVIPNTFYAKFLQLVQHNLDGLTLIEHKDLPRDKH